MGPSLGFSERACDGRARIIGARQDCRISGLDLEVATLFRQYVGQRKTAEIVGFEHHIHILPRQLTHRRRIDVHGATGLALTRDRCVDFRAGRPLARGEQRVGSLPFGPRRCQQALIPVRKRERHSGSDYVKV